MIRKLFYFLVAVLISLGLFYRFWFLRQPERNIPAAETAFVSPANGKVVSITELDAAGLSNIPKNTLGHVKSLLNEVDSVCTVISIQMTPLHVHYQRAPRNAVLLKSNYVKGEFGNAIVMNNEMGIRFENEHNEWLFQENDGNRFKVIQISGFVARRIEDFLKPGQKVEKGQIIGLIKLGSQITVVLPATYKCRVNVGETVTDGETILAEKK